MNRRDLFKTAALAGVLPRIGVGERRSPSQPADQPIVVEGLFAGSMRASHLKGMQQGGVHCGVASGPTDLAAYAALLRFFDERSAEVVLARTVAEIRSARAAGKIANVFCWQSADALGHEFNSPLGRSSTTLRAFYEMGLRIVGLCYNVANPFGAGCLEPRTPLSRAGQRLVEEIHRLRIVLDVGGHTGEQTSLDAIAISKGVPVVCTHTNVAAIADNARCVSDRVIDAIAATGGVIGITAVSDFHVRGKGNTGPVPQVGIDAHIDQYEYIRKRVGIDHVGMGTDFVDGMPIPYGGGINADIIPADMVGEPWRYVKGFESIAEFPNLVAGFRRRGWSEADIAKAMGGNWLRVYRAVWGA